MCVCARARERERETETERDRERMVFAVYFAMGVRLYLDLDLASSYDEYSRQADQPAKAQVRWIVRMPAVTRRVSSGALQQWEFGVELTERVWLCCLS